MTFPSRGRAARAAALALAIALIAGCAFFGPGVSEYVPRDAALAVELDDVPFFPQADYQCGPAALATVLNDSGVDVAASALTREIYLPGRRGSLQVELLASARRQGRLPYRVQGGLAEVISHVHAGYPVLVLQNLGFARLPRWHYAVVVGYVAEDDALLLRSGTERRVSLSAREFLRSWEDGGDWAILTLTPGDIPPAADAGAFIQAAASLEETGRLDAARRAYEAAVERWPGQPGARLGLANIAYAQGDLKAATATLTGLVASDPDHVAARNNLAHVLAEQGCHDSAREVLAPILDDLDASSALFDAVQRTVSALGAGDDAQCPRLDLTMRPSRITASTTH